MLKYLRAKLLPNIPFHTIASESIDLPELLINAVHSYIMYFCIGLHVSAIHPIVQLRTSPQLL